MSRAAEDLKLMFTNPENFAKEAWIQNNILAPPSLIDTYQPFAKAIADTQLLEDRSVIGFVRTTKGKTIVHFSGKKLLDGSLETIWQAIVDSGGGGDVLLGPKLAIQSGKASTVHPGIIKTTAGIKVNLPTEAHDGCAEKKLMSCALYGSMTFVKSSMAAFRVYYGAHTISAKWVSPCASCMEGMFANRSAVFRLK